MCAFTEEQIQEFMTNPETWPKCQWCGKPISYEKYRSKRKDRPNMYYEWKRWRNDAKYCDRICSNRARAMKVVAKNDPTQSKKCQVCGRVFFKTINMSRSRWRETKNCPEHRGLHQPKNGKLKEERDDAIGKPISQGFYVFEMYHPEQQERQNELYCLEYTLPRDRDEKVERICQELNR